MPKPRVIYWFRTDLRLHDSPALQAALDLKPEVLYPIWTWDPHYVYRARVGPNRWQYLLDCQNDLSKSITKINKKSQLFVIREAPQTLFPKLFKAWKITHLVFEKDTDAYAKERDDIVKKIAEESGVEVIVRVGRTLYDPDELVEKNGGKPTMSISQVQHAGAKIGEIPRPLVAPKKLPDPGNTQLQFDQEKPEQDPDINIIQRDGEEKSYVKLSGPKGDFSPPTMEELGLKAATTQHRGGETIALKMLDEIIANEEYTATFEKPKTAPTAFEPQATTLLSPHLHFGSLSVREFYWRVEDIVSSSKWKSKASQPPTSLTGQLLFRDMYFGAQAQLGYIFGQTYKNPTVRFIPWHLPSEIDTSTGLITGKYLIDNAEAEEHFQRWKHGRTGFPWIDALMRQLKQEGWIHHLGRHAVACFLTRGGCYIDWERGAEVFEEWLIDHEAACNIGNWQWLSCTAFFAQFYRCYSPIAFPQKWDKNGDFVRRYVPELAKFDKKYIYEPWKAPIADQKKWGCRVEGDGGDGAKEGTYPKPMLDFSQRRETCIQAMKNAYHVGLYGNDPKVLDGTWRKLFDDGAEGPTEGKKGPPGSMVETEDAGGHEEVDEGVKTKDAGDTTKVKGKGKSKEPLSPAKAKKEGAKMEKEAGDMGKKAGHKREASQGTLDGMVTRKKKKDETAPNETHFG